jgi:hypothetical protein
MENFWQSWRDKSLSFFILNRGGGIAVWRADVEFFYDPSVFANIEEAFDALC